MPEMTLALGVGGALAGKAASAAVTGKVGGTGRGASAGGPAAMSDPVDEAENSVFAINPMGLPLKELRRLKDQFQDDQGQPVKLDEQQFVDALLSRLTGKGAENFSSERWDAELRTLFKKIDASCSETVTWEEFTNYMLFHVPGFNSGDGACELAHNSAAEALAGAWQCGHADMINSIVVVPDLGTATNGSSSTRRYVTAGRDGFVKVWHPNLTLHKAVDVGNTSSWLSACCWMQKSRKLAVASSNFRIFFYDSSFNPVSHIDHKDGTPLCLGYTESHENKSMEKEILMVGDAKGYVSVFPLDANDWVDQESKPDGKPDSDGMKVKKSSRFKYHKDWVTKVGFVSQLQAMVTCSLDGDINICDIHTNQRKGRDPVRLHKKGVYSWCWCKSYKFFASGGSDRQIIIWNPYTQKAMNYLQGHNAPVFDVLVNESQHQLISMSVDKVVKVWDILNYQCIQTFTDKTEYKPEDRLTCMAFDEEGPALVLGSSLLNVLPVSVKVETSRTHLAPIVGALYNDVFHQVISGDNMGTISVWDVQTGKLEFEFRRAHQDHKMSCMAFDEPKRCLYTGGEDGLIKLWNFSSGQQLRSYTMRQPSEIRSLLWAREGPNNFVVGLAWDRRLYVWPDSRKQTVEPQYVLEDFSGQGHTDDVTCLSRLSSVTGLLATGGDDGYICIWKIQETSGHGASSRRYRLDTRNPRGNSADRQSGKKAEPPAAHKRASQTQPGYPDSPQPSQAEGFPEELESDTGMGSFGVERTIFLEHKECLLTIHADQYARLWSAKQSEFLGKLEFKSAEESPFRLDQGAISAVYANDANTLLFTGHDDGWVRIWDLSKIQVDACPSSLLQVQEMQLHRVAVTSLQQFQIDRKEVIVSASCDWTVALHTMDGGRIGSFSHRGPLWRLSDTKSWCDQPPTEEGVRGEDEDRWGGVSPRRKGGNWQNGANGSVPGIGIGLGMRTQRASKVRTRPVIAAPHSGQGDFGKLSVVERFKPDLTLAEQERARLQKFHVSESSRGKIWSRR
ncbi:unnamed protein product [Effrenium voratum]|uniref:EF-hand domain-containing protein n=1 Tax=Effrenium voratum TaxID=2562239 RepID=A0AA36N525_9DINO|nr:unnamed protein product [Effrenium voratum]